MSTSSTQTQRSRGHTYGALAALGATVVFALIWFSIYRTTFAKFFGEYWLSEFFQEYWQVLVLGILLLSILGLSGYTVGSRALGFGPHVVKTTTTYDYTGETSGQGRKKEEAIEEQSYRTLWDWMAILTISAVVAGVALFFTHRQAQQQHDLQVDQERAQQMLQVQQAKDDALQAYLDQMTLMMLDDKNPLLGSDPEFQASFQASMAARVRTVTVLKRLDGEHNKIVMSFLNESGLVNFGAPGAKVGAFGLANADLNSVGLAENNLSGLDLTFSQLRRANLHDANLAVTNLHFADLAYADLTHADLRDANLLCVNLVDARLQGANLSDANFRGVDLSGANLTDTNLTQEQVNQAGAGNSATRLPGLNKPDWWTDDSTAIVAPGGVPMLRDSRLGASLVAFKDVRPKEEDEIWIPQHVATTRRWGPTGAVVYDVRPNSAAQDAGLIPGDIIFGVDGKRVFGLQDLQHKLDSRVGDPVKFYLWRYYFPGGWERVYLDGRLGY